MNKNPKYNNSLLAIHYSLFTIQKGFTLVEILVSIVILAVGILTVSQMTVMGMRTNTVIKQHMESREALAKGMEVLKLLPINDPLLIATCDSTELDSIPLANKADSTNIVGLTIGDPACTLYDIYWNVADDYPQTGFKTIRMLVLNLRGKQMISADYLKWR